MEAARWCILADGAWDAAIRHEQHRLRLRCGIFFRGPTGVWCPCPSGTGLPDTDAARTSRAPSCLGQQLLLQRRRHRRTRHGFRQTLLVQVWCGLPGCPRRLAADRPDVDEHRQRRSGQRQPTSHHRRVSDGRCREQKPQGYRRGGDRCARYTLQHARRCSGNVGWPAGAMGFRTFTSRLPAT
jgi:hypothetical protein